MVALPLGLIVLTGVCMVFQVAFRSQAGAAARATTTVDTRNTLERITRDLRDATVVVPVSPNPRQRVDIQKPTCGGCTTTVWTRYSCSLPPSGACRRYQGATEGELATKESTDTLVSPTTGELTSTTGKLLLTQLVNHNGQVFQFLGRDSSGNLAADYANPSYVQVDLKVAPHINDKRASDFKNPIELSDGLELRNVFGEQS